MRLSASDRFNNAATHTHSHIETHTGTMTWTFISYTCSGDNDVAWWLPVHVLYLI